MTYSINRRDFVKLTGGLGASLAAVSLAPTALANVCQVEPGSTTGKVGVFNEWDKLEKVFVGHTSKPTLPENNYVFEEYAGLSDDIKRSLTANPGARFDQNNPDWPTVSAQFAALKKVFEDRGIEVVQESVMSDTQSQMHPVGYWPLYPRDPMLAVGDLIINQYTRMPLHRKRLETTRKAINEHVSKTGQQLISMPQPTLADDVSLADESQPYLEGGDIFVLDKDILVGHSGLASSYAGIEWLASVLEPQGYRVHTVELTKDWLHLDCIFATPRRGLFMCTLEGVIGGLQGLPEFLHDWELIETTYKEAKHLGCNGINLEPGVTVIGAEHTRIIGELEKRGVECVTVPFDYASQCGGGPRCATHPMVRRS